MERGGYIQDGTRVMELSEVSAGRYNEQGSLRSQRKAQKDM